MTKKVNFSTRSQLIRGSLRYLVTARVGRNVFLACTFKIDQIHFILNQLKIPEYVSGLSHECMHCTFIG